MIKKINELKNKVEMFRIEINSSFDSIIEDLEHQERCASCNGSQDPQEKCNKVWCKKEDMKKIKRGEAKKIYFCSGTNFVDYSGDVPRDITSKRQIKEIEKREGLVFGGDDLGQEARKNKNDIAEAKKAKAKVMASNVVQQAVQKGIINA